MHGSQGGAVDPNRGAIDSGQIGWSCATYGLALSHRSLTTGSVLRLRAFAIYSFAFYFCRWNAANTLEALVNAAEHAALPHTQLVKIRDQVIRCNVVV